MKQLPSVFLASLGLLLMAAALVACHGEECIATPGEPGSLEDAAGTRNPLTGTCDFVSRPPRGGDCDDFGTLDAEQAPEPAPDQAFCFSGCEGLDEMQCIGDPACRSIYDDAADTGGIFKDCWGIAPSGPDSELTCTGQDAYSCSRANHCAAVHDSDGTFARCIDEKTTCSSTSDCDGNLRCTTERGDCFENPECDGGDCDDVCYGFCGVPSFDPGECTGEVACDEPEPECPAGTLAGRDEACWTGYCIPVDACGGGAICAELSETDCSSTASCTGYYRGEDCSCDATGCSCTSYTYEGCGEA